MHLGSKIHNFNHITSRLGTALGIKPYF